MTLWWLSYGDADGPRGVVIVRAESFILACVRARQLGVSPGGAVGGFEVPPQELGTYEPLEGRFLSVAEAKALGGYEDEL